jgi:methionyl aminopeptidase
VFALMILLKNLMIVFRKKKSSLQQTDPPSIPVLELFPSGDFPQGEIQQYNDE